MKEAKDFLATKLTAGAPDALPKAAWWPAHLHAFEACLDVIDGLRERAIVARAKAIAHAAEWDRIIAVSVPRKLMERHVEFECDLLEMARNKDLAGIDRIGEYLLANATAQARGFASSVQAFPEERFLRLFETHLALVAEMVMEKFGAAKPGELPCHERAEANALALAAFSVEWF